MSVWVSINFGYNKIKRKVWVIQQILLVILKLYRGFGYTYRISKTVELYWIVLEQLRETPNYVKLG